MFPRRVTLFLIPAATAPRPNGAAETAETPPPPRPLHIALDALRIPEVLASNVLSAEYIVEYR